MDKRESIVLNHNTKVYFSLHSNSHSTMPRSDFFTKDKRGKEERNVDIFSEDGNLSSRSDTCSC